MKFFNYLSEDWVTLKKQYGRLIDIFVNPSSKEIKEIQKQDGWDQVRFIADFKKRKLYVWSSEIIHYDAVKILAHENLLLHDQIDRLFEYCCMGIGIIVGNKINFEELYDRARKKDFEFATYPNSNDTWLNSWFTHPFLKTLKTLIEKLD